MAAPPKLTGKREQRLLGLLAFGEPLEAAARAVRVSSTAIRKRAGRDPAFADRLRAARSGTEPEPLDWTAVARQLEAEDPEHWRLPEFGLFDAGHGADSRAR